MQMDTTAGAAVLVGSSSPNNAPVVDQASPFHQNVI